MTDEMKPLPCPFCGGEPTTLARPDNIDGTEFYAAVACYCGSYSACAHKGAQRKTQDDATAEAIAAWNRRAQPEPAASADSDCPYYISGPYHNGSYSMCELETGRVLFNTLRNAQKADAAPSVAPEPPTREALAEIVRSHLTATYHCTRVWEAWHVGTMTEDDFEPASESGMAEDIADAILAAHPPQTPSVAPEPVAHCQLTPSGRIAYFDGKPMVMPGAIGNTVHPTPLFAHPPRAPLTDAEIDCLRGLDTERRVRFYEHDFYVLSNFSAFNLEWEGMTFQTSEAAYHWEKFATEADDDTRNSVAYAIYKAPSAHEAFKIAETQKHLRRPDWDDVKVGIMRAILRAKADQHEYVRRKLLATGDRELVEDSWRDDFWGWGPTRDGQNMLGKLWMEVRTELREVEARLGAGRAG